MHNETISEQNWVGYLGARLAPLEQNGGEEGGWRGGHVGNGLRQQQGDTPISRFPSSVNYALLFNWGEGEMNKACYK